MFSRTSRFFGLFLVVSDFFLLIVAFSIAYVIRVQYDHRPLVNAVFALDYLTLVASITPLWILTFAMLGLYSPSVYRLRIKSWSRIAAGCVIGVLTMIAFEYFLKQPIFPARLITVYVFVAACGLLIAKRELVVFHQKVLCKNPRNRTRVLLIGGSVVTKQLSKFLSENNSGYQIIAQAGAKKFVAKNRNIKHFADLDEALKNIRRLGVNMIIQTDLAEDSEVNRKILASAEAAHIDYSFIPGETAFYSGKNAVDVFFGYPVITVSQTPLFGWSIIFKRLFDLMVVVVLLPVWVALFLVIIVLQKIFNRGPIFYKQTRMGLHKKRFKIYKFRSMIPEYCGQDALKIFEKMGRADLAAQYQKHRKIKDDPRITKFGRFLRRSSLDELAQLINVVKGDLSLVGPRPILPDELDFYRDHSPLLLSVKPGLTSLASVSGRSDLSFGERVNLELFYAKNWSFWLDMKILVKTILVALSGKGAA
jgi:exopolysaccharide biosynthesis polyprenyl glycosylphosphotransferase